MTDANFIRRSQVVTTFGPGAMVDLPNQSIIVMGLNHWSRRGRNEIHEPRLVQKLRAALGVPNLQLLSPPAYEDANAQQWQRKKISQYIRGLVFPGWFVTQDPMAGGGGAFRRRRLVRWAELSKGRYLDPDDRKPKTVVPVRFVCACHRGHIEDIDWRTYIHRSTSSGCSRSLWMEERGTAGDVADVVVGCDCGAERQLYEAVMPESHALGPCNGKRPWLGRYAGEACGVPMRLLVRTASNAYFPELMSAISLPGRDEDLAVKVKAQWQLLSQVKSLDELRTLFRLLPSVRVEFDGDDESEILAAIEHERGGDAGLAQTAVKPAEFDILASGKPIIGRDAADSDFFAQTLRREEWDPQADPVLTAIERVVLVRRLREVIAQVGFTRFDAPATDERGELDLAVERAALDEDITWLPAVENRGEGVFLQIRQDVIEAWLQRPAVRDRAVELQEGFIGWTKERPKSKRLFPGAPYVMLHSLSHLLMTVIALDCGYPASSLRERVYAFDGRYGILIHTGSSDAEGTLGGLVESGKRLGRYLHDALKLGKLCSNDPICAHHRADDPHERRFLHGAACHTCLLIAETSCEQRNDFLDRALVVPTLSTHAAGFFADTAAQ